jgi:hypothetical protein
MLPFIGSTFAPNGFTVACHHMHCGVDFDSWWRAMAKPIPILPHCKSGTILVCFTYQNECAQALIRTGNRWAVNPNWS